jgi:uncharacterized SAM-binding protein YcdF (DUF218 family)
LATIVAAVVFHPVWLSWLGSFLILADAPVRADLVVVLAGDWHGLRILEGARLVKEGYAPKVVVSRAHGFYTGAGRTSLPFRSSLTVDIRGNGSSHFASRRGPRVKRRAK